MNEEEKELWQLLKNIEYAYDSDDADAACSAAMRYVEEKLSDLEDEIDELKYTLKEVGNQ